MPKLKSCKLDNADGFYHLLDDYGERDEIKEKRNRLKNL